MMFSHRVVILDLRERLCLELDTRQLSPKFLSVHNGNYRTWYVKVASGHYSRHYICGGIV